MSNTLEQLRREIDNIDRQIVELFKARMDVSGRVAACKREQGMPVLDAGREEALLDKLAAQAGEEHGAAIRSVYRAILSASREYQREKLGCLSNGGRYGLIGEKLGHSYSPAIHRELGGYDYRLIELKPGEVAPFLAAGDFDGLNVTIPYKRTAMACCTHLTPQAERIGCVNTILRRGDGVLLGHNTDYDGFHYLLRSAGMDVAGKKVLVLGTGGASLTVKTVLEDLGAEETVFISRTGPDNYENLSRHADARILVNTTPVGMYPNVDAAPVDLALFPELEGVCDLIYNPAPTRLLQEGKKRGLRCADGLGMLVAQAKAAAQFFLDTPIPDERIEEILCKLERETRNVILIGMPGSGKTTVGRELARRLGRPFTDTDALVEEETGRAIPDLFAQEGEEAFRVLEHHALARAVSRPGQVIATGGGIVTRQENLSLLRRSARVIFLRRDLKDLPTAGRPISQREDLSVLYRRRLPLYEAAAHLTVDNETVEGTVEEILEYLNR